MRKKFKMTHLFFKTVQLFTENNPPSWLISKEFLWWYEGYVLKLNVNENIKSDFQKIERIR